MEFNKLTVEYLVKEYSSDVDAGIVIAFTSRLPYPSKPIKPTLNSRHTSSEVSKYAKDFADYENAEKIYQEQRSAYLERDRKIGDIVKHFILDVSGAKRLVPKDKIDKVWGLAWERGHSSGYYEVYLNLSELVGLFD